MYLFEVAEAFVHRKHGVQGACQFLLISTGILTHGTWNGHQLAYQLQLPKHQRPFPIFLWTWKIRNSKNSRKDMHVSNTASIIVWKRSIQICNQRVLSRKLKWSMHSPPGARTQLQRIQCLKYKLTSLMLRKSAKFMATMETSLTEIRFLLLGRSIA